MRGRKKGIRPKFDAITIEITPPEESDEENRVNRLLEAKISRVASPNPLKVGNALCLHECFLIYGPIYDKQSRVCAFVPALQLGSSIKWKTVSYCHSNWAINLGSSSFWVQLTFHFVQWKFKGEERLWQFKRAFRWQVTIMQERLGIKWLWWNICAWLKCWSTNYLVGVFWKTKSVIVFCVQI